MDRKVIATLLCLTIVLSFIVIIIEITPVAKAPTTWFVDDVPGSGGPGDPPEDFTSIQDAINSSQPGDTVFVYNGTYFENVVVNKTIELNGENRNATVINGGGSEDVIKIEADWVNISGISLTNGWNTSMFLSCVNGFQCRNVSIFGKEGKYNGHSGRDALLVNFSSNIIIINSYVIGGRGGDGTDGATGGNGIVVISSDNISIIDSTVLGGIGGDSTGVGDGGNGGRAIVIYTCNSLKIIGNNISGGQRGQGPSPQSFNGNALHLYSCDGIIENNNISNSYDGIGLTETYSMNIESNIIYNCNRGIGFYHGSSAYFEGNILKNNRYGIYGYNEESDGITRPRFYNCSIMNSYYDLVICSTHSHPILINTSFNQSNTYIQSTSTITVKWFLHIMVKDYLGNPVNNARVKIDDNKNGSYTKTFKTDGKGYVKWIPLTEYIEQDIDGDTIGEKTYYTPHKIVAWNDTLVGYAQPIMNESKTVTITLYNGTLLDLEPGWNLISLPRIQSDTNLPTVLQSIDGQYDAVQWYNITDNNDHWKHNHISKPSYLNDLNDINHTMGLWVHITDPGGTTLVVFGEVISSTQNIPLYPGWNLVGYPSTTDKIRISALNNIFFDTDVDAIWTYNATTQTWKEITASDNFEVGRGYWIHSKVTKTWIVPL